MADVSALQCARKVNWALPCRAHFSTSTPIRPPCQSCPPGEVGRTSSRSAPSSLAAHVDATHDGDLSRQGLACAPSSKIAPDAGWGARSRHLLALRGAKPIGAFAEDVDARMCLHHDPLIECRAIKVPNQPSGSRGSACSFPHTRDCSWRKWSLCSAKRGYQAGDEPRLASPSSDNRLI